MIFIPYIGFQREAKKLQKKYPSLSNDLEELMVELEANPAMSVSLGNDCYKVRLAIKSKNKGKSGGARIITLVKIAQDTIHLLSIYDKSEQENISDVRIIEILEDLQDSDETSFL
jgi:hypothetical protein